MHLQHDMFYVGGDCAYAFVCWVVLSSKQRTETPMVRLLSCNSAGNAAGSCQSSVRSAP